MATADIRQFLELEGLLSLRLEELWEAKAESVWGEFQRAMATDDFIAAEAVADSIDLSAIGADISSYAYTVFRADIDFGAQLASGTRTLTSGLALDRTTKTAVLQLKSFLQYGLAMRLQKYLLQLIARRKKKLVQKAEDSALKEFTSFKETGDAQLQMISALHTSRLGGWGFLAEADLVGYTTYKLSAQLDNRTSEFCRFIHGKTFTIESARGILDAAVMLEDPTQLKAIHPWPDQSKLSMGVIKGMSDDLLVANRMHVPPFHPWCRTLMVPVKFETRIEKPRANPEFAKGESTVDDFKELGIKLSEEKVEVWNDYVGAPPIDILTLLTGLPVESLIGKATKLLRVTDKGDVKVGWPTEVGEVSLILNTGTGALQMSRTKASDLVKVFDRHLKDIRYYAEIVGATVLEVKVSAGEAYDVLKEGFLPSPADWPKIRRKLSAAVKNLDEGALGSLSTSQKAVLQLALASTSPKDALLLVSELPSEFSRKLLQNTEFKAVLDFDQTGLS